MQSSMLGIRWKAGLTVSRRSRPRGSLCLLPSFIVLTDLSKGVTGTEPVSEVGETGLRLGTLLPKVLAAEWRPTSATSSPIKTLLS